MNILEYIKQHVPIENYIKDYTELKPCGVYLKGICPLSKNSNSEANCFTVSPKRKIFYCFDCKSGGDLFSLMNLIHNYSPIESITVLKEKYNIHIPEEMIIDGMDK